MDTHGEIIVKAHPSSSQEKIEFKLGMIEIWVKEPADKDKANKAILKALTKFLGRKLKFKRGLKSKEKIIVF